MRQLVELVEKIRVRCITKEYNNMAFHAKLHRAEILPLESILGVGSRESAFDEETDKKLEELALKRLAQNRAINNV